MLAGNRDWKETTAPFQRKESLLFNKNGFNRREKVFSRLALFAGMRA